MALQFFWSSLSLSLSLSPP